MVTQAAAHAEVAMVGAPGRSGARCATIVAQIAAVLALAAAGPLWLILLSPIVLGVPHVVADVRYLVVRAPASLDARALIAVIVPLAVMTALRAAAIAGAPSYPVLEIGLGVAAVIGAVVLAPIVRPLVAFAIVAVAASALVAPRIAMMVLLHGHNAFAFVIWLGWAHGRMRPAHRAAIIAAVVGGAALIAMGAFDHLGGGSMTAPIDGDVLARTLAPGLAPIAATRVVMLFAFAQALHYLIWLRVIPSSVAARPTLRAELGTVAVVLVVMTALAVPALAIVVPAASVRGVYLAIVAFHAWLELAIVAHLIVARAQLVGAR